MSLLSFLHLQRNGNQIRQKLAPAGFQFIRNYKKTHLNRITTTISEMRGHDIIKVAETAFDETGNPLPLKLAVYARDNEAATLFFQFYQRIKQAEKQHSSPSIPV
jgi:hypothetical protein